MERAMDNQNISFQNRLAYDKMSFYYLSLPVLLVGNLMGAFLLSAIQLDVVDSYSIIIWLSISIVMFFYGMYHYMLFKKEDEENKLKDANIWLDRYYADTLINGIIWGSTAFLMFPESSLMNQMLVIFFLFAVGFSAMGILASKKDLLITYVSVMFLPIVLRLFFMENQVSNNIGYILLALVLLMTIASNYYGKVINKGLMSRQDFVSIKHTHEKLKERFFALFERAPVGIYYYNQDLEIEDANEHFLHMNGQKTKNKLLETKINAFKSRQIAAVHKDVFNLKAGDYRGPYAAMDDTDLYVKLSTVPMINAAGEVAGGIAIINDITSEVTAKEEMVRTAYYDFLTNIPNRTLLMDKLKFFLTDKKSDPRYGALLFMDIDNFKKVNETFGHDVGDKLLKQASSRMATVLNSDEVFARVGGDKFALLLPALDKEKSDAENSAKKYIQTIHDVFVEPLAVMGEEYHLSFSTGVVFFKDPEASAFDILKRSETAMYEAKKSARGTDMFYHENMGAYAKEQLSLENDIHRAISNNELSMVYQPQIDLTTDHIVSAEALVRWKHPEKGFISPTIFIPIAEESGTIIKLEEWIFDTVFEEIKQLKNNGDEGTLKRVAVNLSTVHFMQPNFVEKFTLLVAKHKIEPRWVEIEITESGIMRNLDDATKKINELKSFGFTFAIDDFGTGHSSLAYLKKLPVGMIKIDRSFVTNMHQDMGDTMIVESVVSIGQNFNLQVLAEGVEDAVTLAYLKKINCDLYQGRFGYHPVPIEDLVSLLK
ncbi:MAG: EAL domain-containing protein [Sulfurovum sp.]|nr:EAL domain-containing protein [Sulfurovum sp.]